MEKREQEKSKANLLVQYSNFQHVKITVKVGSKSTEKQDGHFYCVNVANRGRQTAEHVVPLVGIPEIWRSDTLLSLLWIDPPLDPYVVISWPPEDQFEHDVYRFANALVRRNLKQEPVSLYGGGLSRSFVLFFTIKDTDAVFVPTPNRQTRVKFPCDFIIKLRFQAKDLPLCRAREYRVQAESWESVKVTPLTA
jgi:hypothetical protein